MRIKKRREGHLTNHHSTDSCPEERDRHKPGQRNGCPKGVMVEASRPPSNERHRNPDANSEQLSLNPIDDVNAPNQRQALFHAGVKAVNLLDRPNSRLLYNQSWKQA